MQQRAQPSADLFRISLILAVAADRWHFDGGIAAAFLAKLYLATGEDRWLDLAKRYQDFSMTSGDEMFHSWQTCKSGWGAGMLYIATEAK